MLLKNDIKPIRNSVSERMSFLKTIFRRFKINNKIIRFIILSLLFILMVGFTSIGLLYYSAKHYGELQSLKEALKSFPEYIKIVPRQIKSRLSANPNILKIEMAPKDYQKLMFFRQQAIEQGHVSTEQKKAVDAKVVVNNKESEKVRLRLKGEVAFYHMNTPKWSMRIITEDGNNILGMNRFSLQHPKRRSFIHSYIFNKLLEAEGYITLNFDLAQVFINDVNKGIYNIEEVPSSLAIQRQGFPEGVMLHFDDTPHMDEKVSFPVGVAESYYGAAIVPYDEDYVLSNPELKKQFIRAAELLDGFRRGDLKASQVFDVRAISYWMALGDIMGAWHGFCWGNMQFYYNPTSDRIQVIPWDAINEDDIAYAESPSHGERVFRLDDPYMNPDSVFWKPLFSDPVVMEAYIKASDKVTHEAYLTEKINKITRDLDRYISILQFDYPQMALEDSLRYIKMNQDYIRRVYLYPSKAFHAYFEAFDKGILTLILTSRKPIPVKILSVSYEKDNIEFLPIGENRFLKGKTPLSEASYQIFKFSKPDFLEWDQNKIKDLKVNYQTIGLTEVKSEQVYDWPSYDENKLNDTVANELKIKE